VNKQCVLVIDDDRRYRDLFEMNLVRRGYRVLLAPDGQTGLDLLEREEVDLAILDLGLPDVDGYHVCSKIRARSPVGIIMVTARSEEAERVRGLRLGADDYVTKPFWADELIARVEAVLRRSSGAPRVRFERFTDGGLEIDVAAQRVTVHDHEVELTAQEYKLLLCLALNAGRALMHGELLRRVWGVGYEEQTELLHTMVRRLRRKIEDDPAAPRHVLTRRGVGYTLAAPARS
jgi:two-component system KDP operon response regulator KdpE